MPKAPATVPANSYSFGLSTVSRPKPRRHVSRGTLALLLALGLVAGGVAWAALHTGGEEPAMLALQFEKGNSYPYQVHLRTNLSTEGAGSQQLNTDLKGIVTLKAVAVRDDVVRLRGPLDAHSVVVNGQPLETLQPIRLRIRLRPDGAVVCGGDVRVPSPTGPVFVGTFGFGPVLPDHEVVPGDSWGVQTRTRCKGAKGALNLTGTLVRHEEETGDGVRSVVRGTMRVRSKGGGLGSGTLISEETMLLDIVRGALLRAQGTGQLDVRGRVPGVPGVTATGTLWYEIKPVA